MTELNIKEMCEPIDNFLNNDKEFIVYSDDVLTGNYSGSKCSGCGNCSGCGPGGCASCGGKCGCKSMDIEDINYKSKVKN